MPDDVDITIPILSEPGGMKLNKLTQATTYKLIRSIERWWSAQGRSSLKEKEEGELYSNLSSLASY